MTSKTYLITFDLLDPTVDLDGLKAFIKTSDLFENWWNHIPGIFLVISGESANRISQAVRRYTKDARLLITETNLLESEGWLPDKSWKWIRRRSSDDVPSGTNA
jgi:hypothetical protein